MHDTSTSDFWIKTKNIIKSKIPQQGYDAWFNNVILEAFDLDSSTITLGVPSEFARDWILSHYNAILNDSLKESSGKKIDINFIVKEMPVGEAGKKEEGGHVSKKDLSLPRLNLNAKYTFDSFVIGQSNQFAHAASLAVAESPAKAYNPLFIYGGVGLGKTHLMQAIGHHIITKHPDVKVSFVSSERFTNQLISAIQNRTTTSFRSMYRNVDILLIDDIHFIAGKESTQEEFFHTFNALHEAHKQIVMSSDRSPKDIPELEERLISRFEWGLVTDIQPPDLETRTAILRKKAEREKVSVPNDVTFFIAEKIKTNIRQLEGSLNRVVAYSKLINKEITVPLAKEVLKDMFNEEKKRVTIDMIQKIVADYFDMRLSDMKARKRTKQVAYPRQIAMYIARELTGLSLPEIGEQFGGRDHTTVIHAVDKIHTDLKSDPNLKNLLNKLIGSIRD